MPPKVKFSREEIIAAALDIVREGGLTALTARSLAAKLGSSAKPVFGLFENMQEVQTEVMIAANAEYQSFLRTEMMRGTYKPYKASGMAYIRFAKEEKELFKLFEQDIRHTTISQGFLLTRLVDRECGMTVYDIIYNYEGGFSAGFWNLVGKVFDQDLKAHYDPTGEDAKTEELVKIWESGEQEWANFYYQVFWEDPPKTIIKTDKLSTKSFIR